MYIYIFLSVMYIVCVFLFQPRAPVDSRLAIRYLIGLPWVFLNFYFLNKGDYYYYYLQEDTGQDIEIATPGLINFNLINFNLNSHKH